LTKISAEWTQVERLWVLAQTQRTVADKVLLQGAIVGTVFAKGWANTNNSIPRRARTGQLMNEQCHFENAGDERERLRPRQGRPLLATRQAQDEIRRKSEIEIKRRTATQLRTIIVKLEQEVANLGESIGSELALATIRDPSHSAFPSSVRTMQARRDNLRASIAALCERLAKVDNR
jgi:hypothetical protein